MFSRHLHRRRRRGPRPSQVVGGSSKEREILGEDSSLRNGSLSPFIPWPDPLRLAFSIRAILHHSCCLRRYLTELLSLLDSSSCASGCSDSSLGIGYRSQLASLYMRYKVVA